MQFDNKDINSKKYLQIANKIIFSNKLIQDKINFLYYTTWNDNVRKKFEKNNFRSLVQIEYDDYEPIKFNIDDKIKEIKGIVKRTKNELGKDDPISKIIIRNSISNIHTLEALRHRGTKKFYEYSKKLYGSSNDEILDKKTLIEIANNITSIIKNWKKIRNTSNEQIDSEKAAKILKKRLKEYFKRDIEVYIADNLSSDALASKDGIVIRKGAKFTKDTLNVYEVHEGWVHMGCFLNEKMQPYVKNLSYLCPRTEIIQEGLAVFFELLSLSIYPERAQKIVDRVRTINMAENGGNFLDIMNWYKENGYSEKESFINTARIFQGGDINGYPNTRDLTYLKGAIEIIKYINVVLENEKYDLLPLLFIGFFAIEDMLDLYSLYNDYIVVKPKYIPAIFEKNYLNKFFNQFKFIIKHI